MNKETEQQEIENSNKAGCELFGHMPEPKIDTNNNITIICQRCGKVL